MINNIKLCLTETEQTMPTNGYNAGETHPMMIITKIKYVQYKHLL